MFAKHLEDRLVWIQMITVTVPHFWSLLLWLWRKNRRYPTVVCPNGWSQTIAGGCGVYLANFCPSQKSYENPFLWTWIYSCLEWYRQNSESGLTVTETQIWPIESNSRTVHVSGLRIALLFISQTNVFWCSTQERRKNISLAVSATFGTSCTFQNYQFNSILDRSILSTAFWLNYPVHRVEVEASTIKSGWLEQIAGVIRGELTSACPLLRAFLTFPLYFKASPVPGINASWGINGSSLGKVKAVFPVCEIPTSPRTRNLSKLYLCCSQSFTAL